SPVLQALVGLRADGVETRRHAEGELTQELAIQRERVELDRQIEQGSPFEAALRALIYVRRPERTFDERGFAVLKAINSEQQPSERVSLSKFKELMKKQFLIMTLDEERAIAAIPKLLPSHRKQREALVGAIRRVVTSGGPLQEESRRRLSRIETL